MNVAAHQTSDDMKRAEQEVTAKTDAPDEPPIANRGAASPSKPTVIQPLNNVSDGNQDD